MPPPQLFATWFSALPSVDIETLNQDEKTCGICHVEYSSSPPSASSDEHDPPEKPLRLACGHVFGERCLKTWLSPGPNGGNSDSCPLCRHQLFDTGRRDNRSLVEQMAALNFIQDPVVDAVYHERRAAPTADEAVQLGWHERLQGERQRLARLTQLVEEYEQRLERERQEWNARMAMRMNLMRDLGRRWGEEDGQRRAAEVAIEEEVQRRRQRMQEQRIRVQRIQEPRQQRIRERREQRILERREQRIQERREQRTQNRQARRARREA